MSDPTPPPPPPNLAPPPGYDAYQPTNWDSGLRRVGGLAKWIAVLLLINAAMSLVSLLTSASVRDAARDYLVTRTRDKDSFNDSLALWGITGLVNGLVTIAILVLSVIWLFRISSNHRSLGRTLTWAPAWAIAGWVLPPLLYIIPLLVLREAWKAANPSSPAGSQTWKSDGGENPTLWIWFLVYSIVPLALAIAGASNFNFGNGTEKIAKRFVDHFGPILAQSIFAMLAAIAWLFVVRQLTHRHTELTGESSAR